MLRLDDAPLVRAGPPAAQVNVTRERLTTAWLDAQVAAFEIRDGIDRLDAIAQRLSNADRWFTEHGQDDPIYETAYRLRRELENEQRGLAITQQFLHRRCWTACTATFVLLHALPHADQLVWGYTQGFPTEGTSIDHPRVIWSALMGEVSPPGNWPAEERDLWTTRGQQVEYWNRPDLQIRYAQHTGGEPQ